MADPEQEDAYYHPSGVPVSPQARRLGYEFPVYVSRTVWGENCSWVQGHDTNTDKRIFELLTACYEGMMKRLAVSEDFVQYFFKIWFWQKNLGKDKKKKRRGLMGARLFLDPENGRPWMYIYNPSADTLDQLKKGADPADHAGPPETYTGKEALEAERLDSFKKDVLV